MATMIPEYIDSDTLSNAEKKIFDWFTNDSSTRGWYVLHSLNLAFGTKTKVLSESDFVVLAPEIGVFVLEVKGGRVECKSGTWSFTDRNGKTTYKSPSKSPFKQAQDGMFAIKDYLKGHEKAGEKLEDVLMGHGVMFPDIIFDSQSIEFNSELVFDSEDGCEVGNFVWQLYWDRGAELKRTHIGFRVPSQKDIDRILNILRPDFSFEISFLSDVNDVSHKLNKLTEQQFNILDSIEHNDRNVVSGLAGTGKTVLAVETTRRLKRSGKRVGFFCYNRNLGTRINKEFKKFQSFEKPEYVGTFHSYINQGKPYSEYDSEYLCKILPEEFCRKEIPEGDLFDAIVVDEIQDLITPEYLSVLDKILIGGLKTGKWMFFGDIEMQKIYNDNPTDNLLRMIDQYTFQYSRANLTMNCRNTNQIHDMTTSIVNIENSIWKKSDRNGPEVNIRTAKSKEIAAEKVKAILKSLLDESIPPNEITILSDVSFDKSSAYLLKDEFRIKNYDSWSSGITFSTVHGFKGLENEIIILTDLKSCRDEELTYIGLTRAKVGLYLVAFEEFIAEYYAKIM